MKGLGVLLFGSACFIGGLYLGSKMQVVECEAYDEDEACGDEEELETGEGAEEIL